MFHGFDLLCNAKCGLMYITKNDYSLRIGIEHLDEILEQAIETTGLTADNVRQNAEAWGRAYIKSYLDSRYNMDAEFGLADTSADRNFLIMQALIDLALCTIHKTVNPRDMPDHIRLACEDVQAWLIKARDGEIILSLPADEDETPDSSGNSNTFINSQRKFISKPFTDLSLFDEE